MLSGVAKLSNLRSSTLCDELYIKNARECLTMISKHEKAYEEARGAKPRELYNYIAFECFDITGKHERKFLILCLSQFQLGTSPRGNPGEKFFERANPGHPGKFFCLIPCPGEKMMVEFPGGGAKFSQTRRNCSVLRIKLAKVLKN